MNRKVLLCVVLSVLTVIIGLPLTFKQNWRHFPGKSNLQANPSANTLRTVTAFNEESAFLLQHLVSDSVRILFRFAPNTCDSLEPEFSDGLKHTINHIGMNRILFVISAQTAKDIRFFRNRTKLLYPVFSTTEPLHEVYDMMQQPYACIVLPDMTIRNVVTVNPKNMNDLIADVKQIID